MLTPEESEELRRLRRSAFAPENALAPADIARMRELEDRRVARETSEPAHTDAAADEPSGQPTEPEAPPRRRRAGTRIA